jgi:hypothetical protein
LEYLNKELFQLNKNGENNIPQNLDRVEDQRFNYSSNNINFNNTKTGTILLCSNCEPLIHNKDMKSSQCIYHHNVILLSPTQKELYSDSLN